MKRVKATGIVMALATVVALGTVVSACSEDVAAPDTLTPRVTALSEQALAVGEPLNFYGVNFLEPEEGATKLVFSGSFAGSDEDGNVTVEKVAPFTVAPIFDGLFPDGGSENGVAVEPGGTSLRWNRFGPFRVPFGVAGNKPGRFSGNVTAVNFYADGTTMSGEPVDISIDVEPSLIITKLEPIIGFPEDGGFETANCGAPAVRGINGMAYVMEVEAIGFRPKYFIWQVTGIEGPQNGAEITHPAAGPIDTLGNFNVHPDDPPIVFKRLGDGDGFNLAAIRVTAVDENNNTYHTALPLTVVRPMGFHYDGNRELAEYYEPVAVHGPVVGGIGSTLTYAESHTESRQQGVSMSLSKNFVQTQGQVNSESLTEGVSQTSTQSVTNSMGQSHSESQNSSETFGTTYNSSESNKVDFSTTEGANWGWNASENKSSEEYTTKLNELSGSLNTEVSASVTGEGSVPGFAKVSGTVGTKVGVGVGAKTGNTEGEKNASGESFGNHMYESDSETKAFGSVTTDGQSESLSGTYGLASQNSINSSTAESQANSESVSFQMGKTASVSEQVSQGESQAWSESWSSTTSDTTLLSYTAKVPRGRCAVIYRQTIRHVRQAQVYSYDLCGVRSLAGEAVFNEWSWSPNIAVGSDCDNSLPPSTQPAAACFLACE